MAIKGRNTRSANFIAAKIRVPGGKRIEDRLPFLSGLQSARPKCKAKPRSYCDQTVAPCCLQGRFGRGRGMPVKASAGPPLGLGKLHGIVLQSNPRSSVKGARHRFAQITAINVHKIRRSRRRSPSGPSLGSKFPSLVPDAVRPDASARVLARCRTAFDPSLFFPAVGRRT